MLTNLKTDPRLQIGAGALLLGLAYPPFPLPFLTIPGFALLAAGTLTLKSARWGWLWSWGGLVLWNLLVAYWLLMATVAGGLASNLANAAVMLAALRAALFVLDARLPLLLRTSGAAGIWTLFEGFHHWWDLAWPWLSLGNAYASVPALVQFYSITGMFGGTFFSAWAAFLLTDALVNRSAAVRWLAIPALPFVLSLIVFPFYTEPVANRVLRVAVVQPNHDSYLPQSGYEESIGPARTLVHMTDSLLLENPADIILWPENGLDDMIYAGYPSVTLDMLSRLSARHRVPLVTGSSYWEAYSAKPDFLTRTRSDGSAFDVFNAALRIDSTGISSVYKKQHLVPIVERFPFADWLLKPVSGWLDIRGVLGYGRGTTLFNFDAGSTALPAMVCYDSVFPDAVRKTALAGAGLLTVITNDGWWGHSSGHVQHFAYARLRAIETRRYVVRSANNGISGVIRPDGTDALKTAYWTRTAFTAAVPVLDGLTIFTRYGVWMLWVSGGLAAVALAFKLFRR